MCERGQVAEADPVPPPLSYGLKTVPKEDIIEAHKTRFNRNLFLTLGLRITTIVVFNLFYKSTKSMLLIMKYVSKHNGLQIFVLKFNNYK